MSGIAGIYNLDQSLADKAILNEMVTKIKHRGQDGQGFWLEKNFGLGHCLSKSPGRVSSVQPIVKDQIILAMDGELYNWKELSQELKIDNCSDAEIIAASYKKWGVDCLNKFNGGWVFVLWDKKKKILFGARDHFGIKPFYYHKDKNKFIFGSEMKAILAHPGIKAKPNDRILWDFLIDDLIDHSTDTFFEGVKELWGGHYFILEKNRLKIEKYYLALDGLKQEIKDDQTSISEFKALVEDSVQRRLPQEGPVAVSLSGGIDSSSVVCLNDKLLAPTQAQHTFSARFKNSPLDENRYMNTVIQKTKVKPHFLFVEEKDLEKELSKLIWHQEIPFSGTSIYAQWQVFKAVSKSKIKVILEGVGADVLLAGYTGLIGIYLVDLLKKGKLITVLKELYYFQRLHGSLWSLFQELFIKSIHFGVFGQTFAKLVEANYWPEYKLIDSQYLKKYASIPLEKYDRQNVFNNSMINNFFISLNPVLRFEDRSLNAFGLSSRLPFIDHRIVEFGFKLPDNQKIRNGETKWILRQAMKGILPEKIRNRHDKIGFATPPEWLKKGLKDQMMAVFSSESFAKRGYFNAPKTIELYEKFLRGEIRHYHLFWRAYNLEMWFRTFID